MMPIGLKLFLTGISCMMACIVLHAIGYDSTVSVLCFEIAFYLATGGFIVSITQGLFRRIYAQKLQARLTATNEVLAESDCLEDLINLTYFELLLRFPDQDPNTIEWEITAPLDDKCA